MKIAIIFLIGICLFLSSILDDLKDSLALFIEENTDMDEDKIDDILLTESFDTKRKFIFLLGVGAILCLIL